MFHQICPSTKKWRRFHWLKKRTFWGVTWHHYNLAQRICFNLSANVWRQTLWLSITCLIQSHTGVYIYLLYLHSFTDISLHICIPDYPEVENCTWQLPCNQTSSKLGASWDQTFQHIPRYPSWALGHLWLKAVQLAVLAGPTYLFFKSLSHGGFPKVTESSRLVCTVSPTSFKPCSENTNSRFQVFISSYV